MLKGNSTVHSSEENGRRPTIMSHHLTAEVASSCWLTQRRSGKPSVLQVVELKSSAQQDEQQDRVLKGLHEVHRGSISTCRVYKASPGPQLPCDLHITESCELTDLQMTFTPDWCEEPRLSRRNVFCVSHKRGGIFTGSSFSSERAQVKTEKF